MLARGTLVDHSCTRIMSRATGPWSGWCRRGTPARSPVSRGFITKFPKRPIGSRTLSDNQNCFTELFCQKYQVQQAKG